jgi:membrane protease YdiL (CAAX protease family)
MGALLVTAALILYNNALNRWPPFNAAAYVPLNLTLTSALLILALGPFGLSPAALGLGSVEPLDVLVGAGLGILLAAPLGALLTTERGRSRLRDRRMESISGGALAYRALVRVPLGTAVTEEVVFRGVLFALWRGLGTVPAASLSSIVFGLWHIGPAHNMLEINRRGGPNTVPAGAVVLSVVLTAAGGGALMWLRLATGSLVVTILVHAIVNSLATIASARAWREAAMPRGGG